MTHSEYVQSILAQEDALAMLRRAAVYCDEMWGILAQDPSAEAQDLYGARCKEHCQAYQQAAGILENLSNEL